MITSSGGTTATLDEPEVTTSYSSCDEGRWGEIYGIRFYCSNPEPEPEPDPISVIEQRIIRDAAKARQVMSLLAKYAEVPKLLQGHRRPFTALKMPTSISGFRARKLKERMQ